MTYENFKEKINWDLVNIPFKILFTVGLKLLWNSNCLYDRLPVKSLCELLLLRIRIQRVGQKLNSLSDYMASPKPCQNQYDLRGCGAWMYTKSFAAVKLVHSWSCTLPLAQTRAGLSLLSFTPRGGGTHIHSHIKGPWRRERSKAAPGDKYTQSEPFGQFALNAGKWEQTRCWEKGRDCE